MTTLEHHVVYRDVLTREGADVDRFARAAIGRGPAAATITRTGARHGLSQRALIEEAASRVDPLLDVDMEDILVSGWRTNDSLIDAARRTASTDEDEELVRLGTHEMTWTADPTIEVTVDGEVVHTVRVHLVAEAEVHDATALVAEGRLVALRSGDADIHARVDVDGQRVATGELRVNLPSSLDLGSGVELSSGE